MLIQHVVPVRVKERLDALPPEANGMPVNLYHTHDYLVINAGLPRCLPDKIRVFVTSARMLIQAERHPGEEPSHEEQERTYILSELPEGAVGRVLDLPQGDWAYAAAEAHFANGLLTVSIPTQARAEYLSQMHAA
jgi:HSP20 family molecular chaperone IbpA